MKNERVKFTLLFRLPGIRNDFAGTNEVIVIRWKGLNVTKKHVLLCAENRFSFSIEVQSSINAVFLNSLGDEPLSSFLNLFRCQSHYKVEEEQQNIEIYIRIFWNADRSSLSHHRYCNGLKALILCILSGENRER